MGSLYECLREARLEKFYPTLRANGFSSAESLTELTSEDVTSLGNVSGDEHRRLCELVDIIRSVYEVDIDDLPNVSEATAYSVSMPVSRQQSQQNKLARKRNRSPIYSSSNVPLRRSETVARTERPKPTLRRHVSLSEPSRSRPSYDRYEASAYPADSNTSNDDTNSDSSGPSDYEPATKHVNRVSATPPRTRKVASVERVKHTSGYNYGLPKNKTKQKLSQSRDSIGAKIRVCVRKRPRNKREIRAADDDVVVVERSDTLTINEPKLAVDLTPYTLQHEFCFDEVFHEGCGNEEVFERAAKPLIDCVFQGGSATCFAYGQTGAGKTHTMLGSREHPGLYLLSAQEIFSITQSGQYGTGLKVWVSFFEIYCGQLFDLLNKRNRLHAREDGSHRVCIAGLTETQVTDVPSIMQVLEYGNQVRSKGATGVNPDSSRSHAILQVEVRQASDKRLGRMSFIDLAGSERAADVTDTDRQTRMEGAEINQSLLALKECIRSIDQDSRHTPFRQSKLTHILKDSFIGNSRTCMIANISPTYTACENTLNTLRYADRVKELRKTAGLAVRASRAIAQTVLNVPFITPPSLFHPSNISCESTPVKPRMSRKHAGQRTPPSVELADPAETPIRGNFSGIRRSSRDSRQRNTENSSGRQNVPSRIVREKVSASAPVLHQERLDNQTRSSSESNPTLSDTCNLNEQDILVQPRVIRHETVRNSNDTDLDAAAQDLEEIDQELNDLNKTCGKSDAPFMPYSGESAAMAQVAPDSKTRSHSSHQSLASARTSMNVPEIAGNEFVPIGTANFPGGSGGSLSKQSLTSYPIKPLVLRPKPTDFEEEEDEDTVLKENDDLDDILFGSLGELKPHQTVSRELDRLERLPQTRETIATEMGLSRGRDPAPITPRRPDLCVPQASPARSSDLTSFSRSELMKLRAAPTPEVAGNDPDPVRVQATDFHIDATEEIQAGFLVEESIHKDFGLTSHRRHDEGTQLIPEREHKSRRDRTDPLLARHKARQNMPDPSEFLRHLTKQAWSKSPAPTAPVVANIPLPVLPTSNATTNPSTQPRMCVAHHDFIHRSDTRTTPKQPDSLSDHETDLKRVPSTGSVRSQCTPSPSTTDSPGRKTSDGGGGSCPGSLSPVDQRRPPTEARQRRRSRSGSRDREPKKSTTPTLVEVSSSQPTIPQSSFPQSVCASSRLPFLADRIALSTEGYSEPVPDAGAHIEEDFNLPASGDYHHRVDMPSLPSPPTLLTLSGPAHPNLNVDLSRVPISSELQTNSETSQDSPRNGMAINPAITTEKLSTFSPAVGFAPIHPQPLTVDGNHPIMSGVVTKDVVTNRSTALSVTSSTSGSIMKATSNLQRLASAGVPSDINAAKTHIVTAHEEQLAAITSLCKQEMRLLLAYRAGHKDTEEYVKRMLDILNLKMRTVALLHDQMEAFVPSRGQKTNHFTQNQL